jgi:uncharacterized coiled-coil protein SlyX
MNETIMDLQTRLAFQEDSIDIIQLKGIVDDFRDSQGEGGNVTELPPHY